MSNRLSSGEVNIKGKSGNIADVNDDSELLVHRDILVDTVTNAQVSITASHHEMHEGDHYFFKSYIYEAGGTGSTTIFSFATPNTATRIHARASLTPDVDYTVTIYEDATVAGGTPLEGINNDRDSDNVAELTAVSGPTITVPGTAIWTARNGGGKDPIGVSPGFNYEIIAKTNSTYVFELVKNIVQVGVVDIDFWWYEHAPLN